MNRRGFLRLGTGAFCGLAATLPEFRYAWANAAQGDLAFLAAAGSDEITIAATGDSILYDPKLSLAGPGHDELFRTLRGADIAITNCELVLSERGYPKPKDVARAHPEVADAFAWQGMDMVALANNHAMDLGDVGMIETIKALEQRKIAPAGAGRTLAEASKPAIVMRKGIRVGLVSYLCMSSEVADDSAAAAERAGLAAIRGYVVRVPGTGGAADRQFAAPDDASLAQMEAAIRDARRQVDVLLVTYHMHWGGRDLVDEGRRIIARAAIDGGADLVFAHGPHVINPVESYKGRLIFYSLGNFFFHIFTENQPSPPFGATWPGISRSIYNFTTTTDYWEALLLRAVVSKAGIRRVQVLPVALDRSGNPRFPLPTAGAAIMEDFRRMSAGLGARFEAGAWHTDVLV